jgi:hypothetical protein
MLPADQLTLTNGFIFDFIPDQLIEYVVGWNKNRTTTTLYSKVT